MWDRRLNRRARGVVVVALGVGVVSPLSGCVTPLVLREEGVGIGIFGIGKKKMPDDVRYLRIRGFGILGRPGGLNIGYTDLEYLRPPESDEGGEYEMHSWLIATGQAAEGMAERVEGADVYSESDPD